MLKIIQLGQYEEICFFIWIRYILRAIIKTTFFFKKKLEKQNSQIDNYHNKTTKLSPKKFNIVTFLELFLMDLNLKSHVILKFPNFVPYVDLLYKNTLQLS